jgi:hypothetical protein
MKLEVYLVSDGPLFALELGQVGAAVDRHVDTGQLLSACKK